MIVCSGTKGQVCWCCGTRRAGQAVQDFGTGADADRDHGVHVSNDDANVFRAQG